MYEDNDRVYVVNVASGVVFDFLALPSVKGRVVVRLTRLEGTLVREFNIQKDLTNITNIGGACISTDGK